MNISRNFTSMGKFSVLRHNLLNLTLSIFKNKTIEHYWRVYFLACKSSEGKLKYPFCFNVWKLDPHLLLLDCVRLSLNCSVIWHISKDHILFLQYKNKAQKKAILRVGVFLIRPIGILKTFSQCPQFLRVHITLGTHFLVTKKNLSCLSCFRLFSPTSISQAAVWSNQVVHRELGWKPEVFCSKSRFLKIAMSGRVCVRVCVC